MNPANASQQQPPSSSPTNGVDMFNGVNNIGGDGVEHDQKIMNQQIHILKSIQESKLSAAQQHDTSSMQQNRLVPSNTSTAPTQGQANENGSAPVAAFQEVVYLNILYIFL